MKRTIPILMIVAALAALLMCLTFGRCVPPPTTDIDPRTGKPYATMPASSPSSGPSSAPTRPAPLDVTLYAISDTHFGIEGMEAANRRMIDNLNEMPGRDYPTVGKVAAPMAVLHAGDVTDMGLETQWKQFEQLYGQTGKEGLLKFPIFETFGNHDTNMPLGPVTGHIAKRHGSTAYSWDEGALHIATLGKYPDGPVVDWLKKDLAKVGTRRPVLLYLHYGLEGPFSDWWSAAEKDAFAKAIEGYNVIGILHGHYHMSGKYQWKGYDCFLIGSPRHSSHRFLVVHVTDTKMGVYAWDWDKGRWDWRLEKDLPKP